MDTLHTKVSYEPTTGSYHIGYQGTGTSLLLHLLQLLQPLAVKLTVKYVFSSPTVASSLVVQLWNG